MPKVLIVDDSEPDRFLAESALESYSPGIEILQAYDGKEALDMLDTLESPPDFIFLDINMPVMDGHEFLQEYDKREAQTSVVIMLTSSEQQIDKDRSQAYECVKKYLTKPLELLDIENIMLRKY